MVDNPKIFLILTAIVLFTLSFGSYAVDEGYKYYKDSHLFTFFYPKESPKVITQEPVYYEEEISAPKKPQGYTNKNTITPSIVADATVSYTKTNGFTPIKINIKVGQTVRFLNESDDAMFVKVVPFKTLNPFPEFGGTTSIPKGESYYFTFNKKGILIYNNINRSDKEAVVVVE
jgi:plastocyanin